jgi:exonuclease III
MGFMKLNIFTQNMQGLNNPTAPQQLRNYVYPYLRNIDVLCIQEHKLQGDKLSGLSTKLWRQAHFFGCDATEGYGHQAGTIDIGRGGIFLFVNPTIKHMILSQGLIGVNQAQWIRFTGLDGGNIAMLNVYAPHSAQLRSRLWQELRRALPQDCKWVAA